VGNPMGMGLSCLSPDRTTGSMCSENGAGKYYAGISDGVVRKLTDTTVASYARRASKGGVDFRLDA
jgi:hypothetical protein